MIKSIVQSLISKTGKSYIIDKDIPVGLIYHTLFSRFIMLVRGYLFLQKKYLWVKIVLF